MKFTIAFIALCFALHTSAQVCDKNYLLTKPGSWKAHIGTGTGVAAADLVKEKNIVASIHNMIKSGYTPMGVQAENSGAYNRQESNMPGNGYSYSIIPLNFYCDGNTVKTEGETSTYFEIAANTFESAIYDTAQGDRLLAEGFNVMYDLPEEKDGFYFFKEKNTGLGMGITGKRTMWLITYEGKLPYAYVTKKEFLEKRKQILSTLMLQSASGFKDALKSIEIEKSFKEKEFKNDPAKMSKYMTMDYGNQKDRYEKLLSENDASYKPAFAKIDALLKMPASELNSMAIVKNDPKDYLSYLFTDQNDPFRKILIKPNPAYFKKLPKSSPQFFWIYVAADYQEPIAAKCAADLMKAVDFAKLKNMIGK